MRKPFMPLAILCLSLTLSFFPVSQAGSKGTIETETSLNELTSSSEHAAKEISIAAMAEELYSTLRLEDLGLSLNALRYAYQGYAYMRENGYLGKDQILTVVDFSQSSRKKRMYIIDMENKKVLVNTYVAHGRNSGVDMATKFSNRPESLQSSLGFFVTKGTYHGKHGLSLRIDGKEKGINDKAEERAVVIHGANYIGDNRAGAAFMGRSFGCPAVPQAQSAKIINLIKDGSCLFIYHPSQNYLQGSKILNS